MNSCRAVVSSSTCMYTAEAAASLRVPTVRRGRSHDAIVRVGTGRGSCGSSPRRKAPTSRPTHPWSRRGVRLVGYLHLSAAKIAIQRRPLSDSIGPVPMEARHRRFQEAGLRTFCLALIVVQNSSLILCTSYSRTLTPAYLPSVAVALGELVKLVVALLLLLGEQGSVADARRSLASLVASTAM